MKVNCKILKILWSFSSLQRVSCRACRPQRRERLFVYNDKENDSTFRLHCSRFSCFA